VKSGEEEHPEALDQNSRRQLQEGRHKINEADAGNPNGPACDLGGNHFFYEEIPREDFASGGGVETRSAEGEVGVGDGIRQKRTIEELIDQHLGGDDVPGISSAEPVILAAVEEVHEHSESGPEGGCGEKVPKICAQETAFLKEDNSEQLGKKSARDDVGRKRKPVTHLLTHLPHPGQEGIGAIVEKIGCEETEHERLQEKARKEVGAGGTEAGLKCGAKIQASPDSKKRTPLSRRAW